MIAARCCFQKSVARKLRDVMLEMDNTYGKSSPLNKITVLDKIIERCQADLGDMTWFVCHMKFTLECGLLTEKDFSVRQLDVPRGALSSGYVGLFLAKKRLLNHLLNVILVDVKAKPETHKMVQELADHETWKAKCGCGKIKVDVSWQGAMGETDRKIIGFMRIVFEDTLDSSLRSSLKVASSPEEIVTHNPFCSMIEEIGQLIKKESGALQQEVEQPVTLNKPPESDSDLMLDDLLTPEQQKADQAEGLQEWFKAAELKVDQFIKFTPYDPSNLGDQLKGSFISNERSEKIGLWLDSARMGEAATQPHVRVAPFQAETMKKVVQSFVYARGHADEELGKGDMVFFKDAQRKGIESSAAKQLTKVSDSSKMNVILNTFTIQYDVESFLQRRERIKSFVSTTESLLVWAGAEGLKLTKVDRAHYAGSNYIMSIGPVFLPPMADTWLESSAERLDSNFSHFSKGILILLDSSFKNYVKHVM